MLRHIVGALIGAYVAGTVLFGHAYAADNPPMCKPLNDALVALATMAAKEDAKLKPIPPEEMPAFIAKMHSKGVEIEGDAALIWTGKDGHMMVFIRRGQFLCVPSLTPAENKPSDEGHLDSFGQGWV